jgi:hypothetical protein
LAIRAWADQRVTAKTHTSQRQKRRAYLRWSEEDMKRIRTKLSKYFVRVAK